MRGERIGEVVSCCGTMGRNDCHCYSAGSVTNQTCRCTSVLPARWVHAGEDVRRVRKDHSSDITSVVCETEIASSERWSERLVTVGVGPTWPSFGFLAWST